MSRRRRTALLTCGLLVTLGAAATGLRRLAGSPAAPADVPTFKVERTRFSRRVTAEGNLKAVKATPVSAPQTSMAMTITWLAPDGARVKDGEVVIRFDAAQMEKNLADALADRRTAELRMDRQRLETDTALRNRARTADLTREELDRVRAFPARDPQLFSRVDIVESEIDERLYSKKLEHALAAGPGEKELARNKLDLLAIERQKADLFRKRAEAGLKQLEIRAPHDGIFVLQRDWRGKVARVGDSVWPGNPLGEIAFPDELEAQVFVLEADAGGLAKDKPAEVRLEAQPDARFKGRIRLVDALAEPRFSEVPVNYFGVTVALEKSDPAMMKPGQRVKARLDLDDLADALVVPRQAVFDRDGKRVVLRWVGSRFEPVPVTVGPGTAGRVVIEKGVAPGDVLALRDPNRGVRESLEARSDDKPSPGASPGVGP